ncbi:cytochrome C [Alloacidobacterium dinghuense]|uniref:Cytochrome C n=1 Tax=Alloacidobacterium dinghuense TaxID=2763107 RepID=A0A7G8BIQ6_9BACT|nr:cytochrome c3 family protein [Alloacidobacterium dinghuense]QNI32426.1 cytochrome C [Alloacidobacterium dinghuense]
MFRSRFHSEFLLCIFLFLPLLHVSAQTSTKATFVGSEQCRKCHEQIYASWSKTRMANVVRDPAKHPEALLGDFTHPDPVRTFDLKDVAFVYGSRWKQRYFTRRGDEYYVLPAQWDIAQKKWLPFHVEKGTDWWAAYYPDSNFDRPTGPLCDGCHSVNYNIETKQVTEWNVGCEKCHGPGSDHVLHPTKDNIVNPRNLDNVRGTDVCMQCHTQGRPLQETIEGKYYDWPVGYLPGQRLSDYWRLEESKLGTQDFYYFPDGTAHKNRMQGNDFIHSNMYHRGLRCFDCHDVHSSDNPSNLIATGNELCLGCHTKENPAGLKTSVAEHTHHAETSAGSQCAACHMPKIEVTIKGQFVSSHTFNFIWPKMTEQFGIPNACNTCHKDKTPAWATEQLQHWNTISPWRAGS